MKKIKNYFLGLYDYFFALLIFLLPFSNSLPNIILFLLLVTFIFSFQKESFKRYLKSPFFILLLLSVYLFIQSIGNGSFILDLDYYKKHFYLILIPILFLRVENYQLLKKAALVTINTTVIISIFKISRFYFDFGYFPFGDGWATNYVLVLERPYAGIFSVISIIISFDLIQRDISKKYLYISSLILSIVFILFIAIRISFLTLFLLLFIYIFFYLKISAKKKVFFIVSLISFLLLIFVFNDNISKRFFIKNSIEKTIETTKQFEPRVIIVSCVKQIINQPDFSYLFGTDSYSNIQKSLNSCYDNSIEDYSRRNWFLEQHFNTHSQFVDLFLIGGVLAIIIFISFLIKSLFSNYIDFSSVAIILAFTMVLLIENIFHRQFGCFIFTIFTSLYIRKEKNYSNA